MAATQIARAKAPLKRTRIRRTIDPNTTLTKPVGRPILAAAAFQAAASQFFEKFVYARIASVYLQTCHQ